MHKFIVLIVGIFFSLFFSHAYAEKDKEVKVLFEQIFNKWTEAFNHKDLQATCDLFSRSLVADYQGAPQKNYSSLCENFKNIFQKSSSRYHYRFKLHDVHRSGNMASVRVTWYLDRYEKGEHVSETQDEGIDIFEKNKEGKWKIVRFLSYMNAAQACPWLKCY